MNKIKKLVPQRVLHTETWLAWSKGVFIKYQVSTTVQKYPKIEAGAYTYEILCLEKYSK